MEFQFLVMKKLSYIFCLSFALGSCEKVIDVDLNTAEPQLVVEAVMDAEEAVNFVLLTSTGRFNDGEGLGPVTDAVVLLANENTSDALTEVQDGVYALNNFNFQVGYSYTLSIEYTNKLVTASSTLNPSVDIDTVFFSQNLIPTGLGNSNDEEYGVVVGFTDPADQENFYRVLVTVNDTVRSEINVFDDALYNGNYIEQEIFGQRFKAGDNVSVELWSIDKASYEYYRTLADILSSGLNSATPYNPISNLSDGLGHFTLYTKTDKASIVQ